MSNRKQNRLHPIPHKITVKQRPVNRHVSQDEIVASVGSSSTSIIRPFENNITQNHNNHNNHNNRNNANENDQTLQLKLQKIVLEWCAHSTSHGLPNIVRTKYWFLKIMWMCCFLTSASYCSYQIILLVTDYLHYPVLVDMKTVAETPTPFPAVTVCNLNPFNENEGKAFIDSVIQKYNLINEFKNDGINRSAMNFTLSILEVTKIELQHLNITDMERRQYGHQLEDMLVSCTFSETSCGVDDFDWFFSYDFGNCYTFNRGINKYNEKKIRNVSKSGISFGLDVELYVGNKDGLQEYAFESGVLVVVHNQTNAADLDDDGMHIPTGFDTHVLVQREFIYKLGKPYSKCIKNTSNLLGLISSEFHSAYKIDDNNQYNQRHCIKLCYQTFIENSCGCSDASLPKMDSNVDRCRLQFEISCMLYKRSQFYSSIEFEVCEEKCLLECDSVRYSVITTSSSYPSKWYANFLQTNDKGSSRFLNATYSQIKSSLSKVNIFYDDLSYTILSEVAEIKIENEIANFGGELGLFIGISLLSFVEVLELLLEIIIAIYNHRFNKQN